VNIRRTAVVLGAILLPAAATDSSWPEYGHDAQHTGVNPAEHPSNSNVYTEALP
jgi:hypothetical protein